MPGKQQNIPYYAVFNMIRIEIGQDGVAKSKKSEQFSQKLLVSTIIFFVALTQGRFFRPEFCFLMKPGVYCQAKRQ